MRKKYIIFILLFIIFIFFVIYIYNKKDITENDSKVLFINEELENGEVYMVDTTKNEIIEIINEGDRLLYEENENYNPTFGERPTSINKEILE